MRYIHHKGGRYLWIGLAETHAHNGDYDVVYVSLSHGKMVTRPLRKDSRKQDSWQDEVEWPDGVVRSRFCLETEFSASVLSKLETLWAISKSTPRVDDVEVFDVYVPGPQKFPDPTRQQFERYGTRPCIFVDVHVPNVTVESIPVSQGHRAVFKIVETMGCLVWQITIEKM